MQKRGISTIVATVLVVLITVAGVTALWAGIYPMINQITFNEDINLRLTIDKQGGYTIFDDENGVLRLRIKRASDKADIIALKFVIDIEGNSQAYKRYDVPSINTAKIYYFGLGFIEEVTSAKVVPIYNLDGEEFEGSYYAYLDDIPKTSDALDNLEEKDGLVCADESYPGQNDGLVLYYDFEEVQDDGDGIINKLFDLSCKGHMGTIVNAIWDEAGGHDGSGAIEFDGTSGYVDLAERESLATQTGGSKTIAFWAKPECKGDFESSVIFGSFRNFYIDFFGTCGPLERVSFFFDDNYLNWYNAVHEEEWHHYALTINVDASGVTGKLNIDGEEVDSDDDSWTGNYGAVDDFFYFGTRANSGGIAEAANAFDGSVDDFRVYNRALTSEEISGLYTANQK